MHYTSQSRQCRDCFKEERSSPLLRYVTIRYDTLWYSLIRFDTFEGVRLLYLCTVPSLKCLCRSEADFCSYTPLLRKLQVSQSEQPICSSNVTAIFDICKTPPCGILCPGSIGPLMLVGASAPMQIQAAVSFCLRNACHSDTGNTALGEAQWWYERYPFVGAQRYFAKENRWETFSLRISERILSFAKGTILQSLPYEYWADLKWMISFKKNVLPSQHLRNVGGVK